MNIGLIGKGNLGMFLLKKINKEAALSNIRITAIFDEREKARTELSAIADEYMCRAFYQMDEFLESDIDLIVECSNIQTAKEYAPKVIKQKDIMFISVGAFADTAFAKQLQATAKESEHRIYLPSGAIGGLDALKAAKLAGKLESVMLTTRKPAHTLTNEKLDNARIIFEGPAYEAIDKFPKNVNVAIILSLAGIGIEQTIVRIVADPMETRNTHMIEVRGDFGEFQITLKNNPSPDNPKTSYITGSSILASLANLDGIVVVGT